MDVGNYPTGDQGLEAMLSGSAISNWRGPYLKAATLPVDPWNNPYHYQFPSQLTDSETLYDLISAGPDGHLGNNDDITNHDQSHSANE